MAKRLNIIKSYYSELESGRKRLTEKMGKKVKEKLFYKTDRTTRLTASFDWLSLHFRTTDAQEEEVLKEISHLDLEDFTLQDYSRYHYPLYLTYGTLKSHWNDKDEKQGVTIELSGSAYRAFEVQLTEEKRDWYDFLITGLLYEKQLKSKQELALPEEEAFFNMIRMDLSLDEPYLDEGNYEIQTLYDRFESGIVVHKKKGYEQIRKAEKRLYALYWG